MYSIKYLGKWIRTLLQPHLSFPGRNFLLRGQSHWVGVQALLRPWATSIIFLPPMSSLLIHLFHILFLLLDIPLFLFIFMCLALKQPESAHPKVSSIGSLKFPKPAKTSLNLSYTGTCLTGVDVLCA